MDPNDRNSNQRAGFAEFTAKPALFFVFRNLLEEENPKSAAILIQRFKEK